MKERVASVTYLADTMESVALLSLVRGLTALLFGTQCQYPLHCILSACSWMVHPVCTLHGGEFQLGDFPSNVEFITDVAAGYAAAGHTVIEREDLPPICLDRRAVKNSRGHNRGPARIAAFAAVPVVLRYGRILHIEPMLSGPAGTFVAHVAAPVVIAQVEMVAVVTIKSDANGTRLYTHQVYEKQKLRRAALLPSTEPNGEAGQPSGEGAPTGAVWRLLVERYRVKA